MDRTAIRQIGRYRLIDVIGQGGMGVVYRAVDESIDRPVAIKMLLGGFEGDKDLLARFHREVRSTANLQHKNIVTVYALDDYEGIPYMVMEYLEGQSMSELISSRRQLAIVEKLRLVSQVCEGLQYAHERNIIHRDIKPANILVLKDGTAKIVDFGIARVGRNETQTLTQAGQIIGSLYYMSPEQLTPPGIVDARTDIYSTGVTLYQFLTGELPFKSPDNDPQGTILKILHDPVPSLNGLLANIPSGLDEVVNMAMAKNANARFQTAEDFAYELSRIQDSLKHEIAADLLSQAKEAVAQKDLETARQKLQELLRLDKRNADANDLFRFVREQIQRQQRSDQVAHLRSQAQIALAGMQFEEALECVEQARRLDPENDEIALLSISVKNQIDRARELAEALRRGQAALYAGDLDDAGQAIHRALEIDNSHTEARALEGLVKKELEERSRRARLQGFVEQARRELSDRNYLSALHVLKDALAIDPADSNIQELLNWAQRGHEQEKQRNELRNYIDEVGQHIGEQRYIEALACCETALRRFPNDPSLSKLQLLAERQRDIAERRRAIEEACARARRLTDEDNSEEAINVLENELRRFQDEPILLALLANIRSEVRRKLRDNEEGERRLNALSFHVASPQPAPQIRSEVLANVDALRAGLSRNVSISQLSLIAEQLKAASSAEGVAANEDTQTSLLLSEFNLRLARWTKDLRELDEISASISGTKDLGELNSLADRARFLSESHEGDEEIRIRCERIRAKADQQRSDYDNVNSTCLECLRFVQGNQDLDELTKRERQVQVVTVRWIDDPVIRSLVSQTSAFVQEIRERKKQVLHELSKLETSLATARSAGQMRLLEQQARMLVADFPDPDAQGLLESIKALVEEKLARIAQTVQALNDVSNTLDMARSLEQIGRCLSEAESKVQEDSYTEESADLLKRIRRQCEEKKKDHSRVQNNLNHLIASAEVAVDQAELDLILARHRDLLKRFADDPEFLKLGSRLEELVARRREALKEAAAAQAAEEAEDGFEPLGVVETRSVPASAPTAAVETRTRATGRSRKYMFYGSGAFVLAVIAIAIFVFAPKSVSITTNPADATITVDSEPCSNPCTRTLSVGAHKVDVSRAGFRGEEKTINVRWSGATVPVISLLELPKPPIIVPSSPTQEGNEPQLVVQTSVPGVSVFLDYSANPVGITDATGELQLTATAGPHRIRVEKDGFAKSAAQNIRVQPDGQTVASFKLRMLAEPTSPERVRDGKVLETPSRLAENPQLPQPQPSPQPETFLVVQAPPGAEIHIDQQLAGHSTGGPFKARVQPGSRVVEVFLAGYQPYSQVVPLVAGQQVDVVTKLTPVPPPPNPGDSSARANPGMGSPGISDEDRKQIQELLNRYADGYSQKNIKIIQSLWPSIPSDSVKTIKDFFKISKTVDMKLRMNNATPAGKRLTVECLQTLRYSIDGKETTHNESKTLYLIKSDAGWLIDFIPTS
jgi:serine/threonine protein kinase